MLRVVGGADSVKQRAADLEFNRLVGIRLKDRRMDNGLTLDVIARHLGINATTVARHEAGVVPLTCLRAARWCQMLGLPVEELFK